MLSMARFLPRPSVAIRLFSSTTPLSRNTIPPKTKKGLVLRASEVAAACGLNPFVHPAELVKTHWVRTCPNHYKGMAEWAAESYDLPESQDEMAERLTQSTSSTQEITRIALESTRDADDTSILHQASKRMEEELESVSEPSKVWNTSFYSFSFLLHFLTFFYFFLFIRVTKKWLFDACPKILKNWQQE